MGFLCVCVFCLVVCLAMVVWDVGLLYVCFLLGGFGGGGDCGGSFFFFFG